MSVLAKLWGWLDGKKTKLAAAFYIFQDLIVPIWFDGSVPPILDKVLQTLAVLFVALGIGHGAFKGARK